jgi:hypothetical protein
MSADESRWHWKEDTDRLAHIDTLTEHKEIFMLITPRGERRSIFTMRILIVLGMLMGALITLPTPSVAEAAPIPLKGVEDARISLAACTGILKSPATGPCVVALQEALNAVGAATPRLDVDGQFGQKTYDAVKNFQRSRGLQVDGEVGPHTRAALVAAPKPSVITPKPPVAPPVTAPKPPVTQPSMPPVPEAAPKTPGLDDLARDFASILINSGPFPGPCGFSTCTLYISREDTRKLQAIVNDARVKTMQETSGSGLCALMPGPKGAKGVKGVVGKVVPSALCDALVKYGYKRLRDATSDAVKKDACLGIVTLKVDQPGLVTSLRVVNHNSEHCRN